MQEAERCRETLVVASWQQGWQAESALNKHYQSPGAQCYNCITAEIAPPMLLRVSLKQQGFTCIQRWRSSRSGNSSIGSLASMAAHQAAHGFSPDPPVHTSRGSLAFIAGHQAAHHLIHAALPHSRHEVEAKGGPAPGCQRARQAALPVSSQQVCTACDPAHASRSRSREKPPHSREAKGILSSAELLPKCAGQESPAECSHFKARLLRVPHQQPLEQHQPACCAQALDLGAAVTAGRSSMVGPCRQHPVALNGHSSSARAPLNLHPAGPHRVATLLAMAGCACTSHPTMSFWKALFRSVQTPQWGNPRVPPRGSRESSAAQATILRPCSRGSCAISSARGGLSRMVPSRSAGSSGAQKRSQFCGLIATRGLPNGLLHPRKFGRMHD